MRLSPCNEGMHVVLKYLSAGLAMAGAVTGHAAAAGQDLSLTIYNSNLALVEDVRSQEIGAGRQRLEFRDVSAQIRPETVALSGAGIAIVEQNFDYDLLTPAKLMEKAVGKQVQIVRVNPGNGQQVTETATVLSVNDGVVLRIGDRIEVLREDGVPTRVIFDKIPENLRARPTLSVTVDSARAGPRETTLSYLTNGLSWKADYVALFDEKAGKLDLQGWITLTNSSGVDYADAKAQLVAGDVNLVRGLSDYSYAPPRPRAARSAGTEGEGQRAIADYYVYPLPRRTTIANNQTKQVSFLDVSGASARKAYEYRANGFNSSETPTSADVSLQFANSREGGLGSQLPAGIVRVYMRDVEGEAKFIGENRIDHTPQGTELSVKTGEAFDVTVQPTLVASRSTGWGEGRARYSMSYLVRNARSEPATVTIKQLGMWGEVKLIEENMPGKRLNARAMAWDVVAPARGEKLLTFTVETGW